MPLPHKVPVIIYNSSSFGGCYDYAKAIAPWFAAHPAVSQVTVVLPNNAPWQSPLATHPLSQDKVDGSRLYKQVYFLGRVFLNPIKFAAWLKLQPPSLVIFNDFEQLSAPFWTPAIDLLAAQHHYAIILHDPDRDAYPPSLAYTTHCMKAIMRRMHLGLYHDQLPDKPYYKEANGKGTRYLSIPHGLYEVAEPDEALLAQLNQQKRPGLFYASILGNIRKEKNYELAIRAMKELPWLGLIIAGSAANSAVEAAEYHQLATSLGVNDRIIWVERFLSEAEMAAAIAASHAMLLYYARSFTSQSGVFNMAAPFKKLILASDGPSSLAHVLRQFGNGLLAAPDDLQALVALLTQARQFNPQQLEANWQAYLDYASWQKNVDIIMSAALERFHPEVD